MTVRSGFPVRFLVETAHSLATWPYHDAAGRFNALARAGELLGEAVGRWNAQNPDCRCAACSPAAAAFSLATCER